VALVYPQGAARAQAAAPGVVELLPEQMSTLKVEQAGAGDNWRETAATGMISVDETQATPVFLPFSGRSRRSMWKRAPRQRSRC
jgi:hypothetical protein